MAGDLSSEQTPTTGGFALARPAVVPTGRSESTEQGSSRESYAAVFYLTAAFFYSAALLRSVLTMGEDGVLGRALLLLAAWLVLFVAHQLVSPRLPWLFGPYLVAQTALVFALLTLSDSSDFLAVLFAVLSMELVQRWPLRRACVCIALFAPITALGVIEEYDLAVAVVTALTNGAVNCFAAFYAWSARRAEEERHRTESLAAQLTEANHDLQAYSDRIKRLTLVEERSWIARELHDSVTQTIFAMTLAARSLLMLMSGGDRRRVEGQLERLTVLANAALSEMHVLVSELRPDTTEGGLVVALRRHVADRALSDGLTVELDVDGEEQLTAAEEWGLYRIAQEALNNVAKHAGTAQASVQLVLREPFGMEIRDQGRGFDAGAATDGTGLGMTSMRERAGEIGWTLDIITAADQGTVVRVQKDADTTRRAP